MNEYFLTKIEKRLQSHCNQLLSGHEFWEDDYTEEEIEEINKLVIDVVVIIGEV